MICTGAGPSTTSLFQARSHSLALISNCFFLFLYARSKTESQGETEREKAKVCVKGERSWPLPRPSVYPGPPCWQTAHNVCLESLCGPEGRAGTQLRAGKETGDMGGGGGQKRPGHQGEPGQGEDPGGSGCPATSPSSWSGRCGGTDVQLASVLMLSAPWGAHPLPPRLQQVLRGEGAAARVGTVSSHLDSTSGRGGAVSAP